MKLYQSTIKELIKTLETQLNPSEVLTYMKELGEGIFLNPITFRNELNDVLEDYAMKNDMCPECGSSNRITKSSYENYDSDGNRGVWLDYYICINCGKEY